MLRKSTNYGPARRTRWSIRRAKLAASLAVMLPILSLLAGAAVAAIQYGAL